MKQKPTRLSYGLFHTLSHLSEPSRLRALGKKKKKKKLKLPQGVQLKRSGETCSSPLLAVLSIHHATYTLLSHSAARVVLCLAHVWRGHNYGLHQSQLHREATFQSQPPQLTLASLQKKKSGRQNKNTEIRLRSYRWRSESEVGIHSNWQKKQENSPHGMFHESIKFHYHNHLSPWKMFHMRRLLHTLNK